MSYSFHEHTADIRMNVISGSVEELFQDAFFGMIKIMRPSTPKIIKPVSRKIKIETTDPTALLVEFLNETLSLMHLNHEYYHTVKLQLLSDTKLKVELIGYNIDSFKEDVKAVTYHEADIKKIGNKWQTTIIFDI